MYCVKNQVYTKCIKYSTQIGWKKSVKCTLTGRYTVYSVHLSAGYTDTVYINKLSTQCTVYTSQIVTKYSYIPELK